MKRDGGRLAAQTLKRAGVDVVFALHGGHLDTFLTGCKSEGIRLVDVRHEAAAVNAADGYARTTGKIGVAAVTSGPGLTNALAGITNAAADDSPVLVITSSSPIRELETRELQGGLDLISMLSPVTKFAHKVLAAERIADFVGLGIRHALTRPSGPAVIDIPIDIAFTPVAEAALPTSGDPVAPPYPTSSNEAIELAADLLKEAQRPVVIVGEGTLANPEAAFAIKGFADTTGLPIFEGPLSFRGLPRDHPQNGGASGVIAAFGDALGCRPDLVLLAGARQGMYTGGRQGRLVPPDARIIQLDTDPAEIGRLYPVDAALVGDLAQSLTALARARNWPDRTEWCAQAVSLRTASDHLYPDVEMEADGIHPFRAAKNVLSALPPDVILVNDGGECAAWIGMALGQTNVFGTLNLGYQGHLGVGQGYAIGAQLAHPDKRIVQIAGDGAIGFHLQEWDTMVRHNLPIVTVIFNNACWGMSIHGQKAVYGENGDVITKLPSSRYEKVAEGFGAIGEFVKSADEIIPAVERALQANQTAVVNVVVSGSVVHPVTTDLLGDLSAEDEIVVPYYQNIPK